jgi:hypothetical protein
MLELFRIPYVKQAYSIVLADVHLYGQTRELQMVAESCMPSLDSMRSLST